MKTYYYVTELRYIKYEDRVLGSICSYSKGNISWGTSSSMSMAAVSYYFDRSLKILCNTSAPILATLNKKVSPYIPFKCKYGKGRKP